MNPIRITRKARTISAIADERKRIETTAKLAKQFGRKVTVSTKASKRKES